MGDNTFWSGLRGRRLQNNGKTYWMDEKQIKQILEYWDEHYAGMLAPVEYASLSFGIQRGKDAEIKTLCWDEFLWSLDEMRNGERC